MKVTGNNFQKWAKFSLEIEGLTVIVGPSNRGKSALIRAIRAALRNELTAAHIRKLTDGTSITVEVDGTRVTASRSSKGKGSVTYEVNAPGFDKPKEYKKLDGEIPEEVKALGFGQVEIGDLQLDPIFASQFGSQFMLELKPQPLNAILGAFSATEKLEAGKREANTRIREGETIARGLATEVQTAETRLARYTSIADKADVLEAEVSVLEPETTALGNLVDTYDTFIRDYLRLEEIESYQRQMRTLVPELNHETRLAALIEVATTAAIAKQKHENKTYLADKLDISVPDTLDALLTQQHYALALVTARTKLEAAQKLTGTIQEIITDWTSLVQTHRLMRALSQTAAQIEALDSSPIKNTRAALDSLLCYVEGELVRLVEKPMVMTQLLGTLMAALVNRKVTLAELDSVDAELTAMHEKQAVVQQEYEVYQRQQEAERRARENLCPSCGQELNHKHKELSHA